MARIDETKEFIGFLKVVFTISVAIMSSLIAYLYKKDISENYLVLFTLFTDIIFVLFLLKKILKEIKKLKDM